MKTILAPVDFSAGTVGIVDAAAVLARANGARLVALHVVPPTIVVDGEFGSRAAEEYSATLVESAARQLADLQKQFRVQGITIVTEHRAGAAGPAIVEHARALNAAYVVLGSHGHGALHDLIMGSTTTRVLKEAPCAVVVVPAASGPARK